jgi:histone arginine demethylase JMJD6
VDGDVMDSPLSPTGRPATGSAMTNGGFLTDEDWFPVGEAKEKDAKLIDDAKDRARGDLDLKDWTKQGWAYDKDCCKEPKPMGTMPYEDARKLSVEQFIEKYEAPNVPVMLTHVADDWDAVKGAWLPGKLLEKYQDRRFKCGEDDDGFPVKMELKQFLRYMANQRDDSPLYVFDSMYEGNTKTDCGIRREYEVPKYFREDLFRMVGEHRRPPYRWFLLGPKRSGTGVHIDPLGTSAWNTLIYGLKRWVIFPPHFTREEMKAKHLVKKDRGEDDESIDYFNRILPRLLASDPKYAKECIQLVQRPGETIYVPGSWWHAVLNLTDTVAITQNYCSTANFPRVWKAARDGRHGMARKWLRILKAERPDLYSVAKKINKEDGWDIEREAARHKKRVEEKAARKERKRLAWEAAKKAKAARKKERE